MRFYTYPVRHKIRFKEDLNKPFEDIEKNDIYCYTRHLGMQEIVDGHKWRLVHDKECYICRRDSYSIFFWSPTLAKHQEFLKVAPEIHQAVAK
jgi:hypothetical protein